MEWFKASSFFRCQWFRGFDPWIHFENWLLSLRARKFLIDPNVKLILTIISFVCPPTVWKTQWTQFGSIFFAKIVWLLCEKQIINQNSIINTIFLTNVLSILTDRNTKSYQKWNLFYEKCKIKSTNERNELFRRRLPFGDEKNYFEKIKK